VYDHIELPPGGPPISANVEAEQAVPGSVLIDPDAVVGVADLLTTDDFYQQKNRWIYQAILDLKTRNVLLISSRPAAWPAGFGPFQLAAGMGGETGVLA
jgi:hypothetical protein